MLTPPKLFLTGWLLLSGLNGWAQADASRPPEQPDQQSDQSAPKADAGKLAEPRLNSPSLDALPLLNRIRDDQWQFWSAPRALRKPAALKMFLPLAGITAILIASDRSLASQVPANWVQTSRDLSNYAALTLAGGAAGMYAFGHLTRDDHLRETGSLSGEAVLNSALITYALQSATQRQRPFEGNGKGVFFERGSSFPSQHAALAWSVASVVAHEYPGPLTKLLAYGLAATVSVTRVSGRQHFPSDVVVGSALGWYVGRQIFRAHHNPELGGASWVELADSDNDNDATEKEPRPPEKMGSPYVSLDSWVYPHIEKLAALGYIETAFLGLKPWTRMECAQLVERAGGTMSPSDGAEPETAELQSLQEEFAYELGLLDGTRERNRTVALESVYARGVSVIGPALTDSYHFGQTLSDDFGRPFRRGMNAQVGGSFRAALGPAAIFVRAEVQHAPSARELSEPIRNFIATADGVPVPAATPFIAINRVRFLDAYVAMNLKEGWQLSFGKQSLSWGPGPGGSFLWSDNIEPIRMLRLTQSETVLPGLLQVLGPVRVETFLGRLEGHNYIPHPFIYGNKINFKPLPCLELGFGRTVTIGGKGGTPFTTKNFLLSFFGQTSAQLNSVPGDSHSSFDWTLYVPKLRNYLVFYGDLYADDDFVPFQNPRKNPFRPGIYLTRFPGLPKLDFHVEAASTESSNAPKPANLNYWNYTYRDGYTSNGNLIGNTVGRMGQSIQGWFNYWVSPRNSLQFTFKHNTVSQHFVPRGGAWQDYGLRQEVGFRSGFYLKSQLQYEHISRYPLLFPGPQSNITAVVEMGFVPPHSK